MTVWGGFSTRWYGELLHDEQILRAAWLSLRIAVGERDRGRVILGTLAGFVLARMGRFRGRLLLTGMTTAPLVMPEVITGLSLLAPVRRVAGSGRLARRARVTTITIAHITFSMAFCGGG